MQYTPRMLRALVLTAVLGCLPLSTLVAKDPRSSRTGSRRACAQEAVLGNGSAHNLSRLLLNQDLPSGAPAAPTVDEALSELRGFRNSARSVLLERDYLVEAMLTAFIMKTHLMLFGPRGEGKTTIVEWMLHHVMFEHWDPVARQTLLLPSVFQTNITAETQLSHIFGSANLREMRETGRTHRFLDEGVLEHYFSFLDEFDDINPYLIKAFNELLEGRKFSEAGKIHAAKTHSVVVAQNATLSQLFRHFEGRADPQPTFDRFGVLAIASKGFKDFTMNRELFGREAGFSPEGNLRYRSLQTLEVEMQKLVKEMPDHVKDLLALLHDSVEIPMVQRSAASKAESLKNRTQMGDAPPYYRPTRSFSTRTKGRARWFLAARVLLECAKDPSRPRQILAEDLHLLRDYYAVWGPSDDFIRELSSREPEPERKHELELVRNERHDFDEAYKEVVPTFHNRLVGLALTSLQERVRRDKPKTDLERALLHIDLSTRLNELSGYLNQNGTNPDWNAEHIANVAFFSQLNPWVQENPWPGNIPSFSLKVAKTERWVSSAVLKNVRYPKGEPANTEDYELASIKIPEFGSREVLLHNSRGNTTMLTHWNGETLYPVPPQESPPDSRWQVDLSDHEEWTSEDETLDTNAFYYMKVSRWKRNLGNAILLVGESPEIVLGSLDPSTKKVKKLFASNTSNWSYRTNWNVAGLSENGDVLMLWEQAPFEKGTVFLHEIEWKKPEESRITRFRFPFNISKVRVSQDWKTIYFKSEKNDYYYFDRVNQTWTQIEKLPDDEFPLLSPDSMRAVFEQGR